jgi:hypothetical protein
MLGQCLLIPPSVELYCSTMPPAVILAELLLPSKDFRCWTPPEHSTRIEIALGASILWYHAIERKRDWAGGGGAGAA